MNVKRFPHKEANVSINGKDELFEVCGTYDADGSYIEITDFRLVIKDKTFDCSDLLLVPDVMCSVIEQVRVQL